jgi:hypothetical protein
VTNIKMRNMGLERAICNVKSVRSLTPNVTPSTSAVLTESPDSHARLVLTVKEVSVRVDHEWKMDWNTKRQGSYCGTNSVSVKGLSCQIFLCIYPDDRGPVIESATINLGRVEHNCRFTNASFVSEMLAKAALDWFAEPLTRLLQSASQTAIEEFLKDMSGDFRLNTWNPVVLGIFPPGLLADILGALDQHLPRQGVPF